MKIEDAIRELMDENRQTLSPSAKETLKFIFETEDGKMAFDLWMDGGDKEFEIPYEVDFEQLYRQTLRNSGMQNESTVPKSAKVGISRALDVFYRVAAIMVIPLLLYILIKEYSGNDMVALSGLSDEEKIEMIMSCRETYEPLGLEYYSPAGSQVKITLADSSVVTLNGDSRITLLKSFNSENRYLKLEGEAHFDVAKNDSLGFTVNAQGINVVALGTSFYVQAYPEEKTVEAVLLEGMIGVSKDGEMVRNSYKHILRPNERYVYTKESGNEILNVEENTKSYESWTYGELIFNDTPMGDIINKLEHFYGVDIIVKDSRIYSYHLTATWSNKSISQIMELLKYSSPIVYEISQDTITINMK